MKHTWTLPAIVAVSLMLSACASTTIYQPVVMNGKEGTQAAKAVKVMNIAGDVNGAFTLTTKPGGHVTLDVKPLDGSQVLMQRIAVTDSKGNPLLTKDGQPVFNEIPLVAGLNHSFPTKARGEAASGIIRSAGSAAGTIGTIAIGSTVGGGLAGAIPTP